MEQLLGQVVKALPKLIGAGDEEFGEASRFGVGYSSDGAGKMNVGAVLQGEHGACIATAVVKVAQKVEKGVRRIVAVAATPGNQARASAIPGSCTIKQVRRASNKLLSANLVPAAASASTKQQPHISVAVAPLGGGAPSSKWEDLSTSSGKATRGNMLVDTGAGITLVTKTWAEAHGLKISAPLPTSVYGAAGQAVDVVGTTSFTVQLSPTLELDVANVSVSSGSFY